MVKVLNLYAGIGGNREDFEAAYGLHLPDCADDWGRYKRRQVMHNCVNPQIGLAVYRAALDQRSPENPTLFDAVLDSCSETD
jgi:hypothetical protein